MPVTRSRRRRADSGESESSQDVNGISMSAAQTPRRITRRQQALKNEASDAIERSDLESSSSEGEDVSESKAGATLAQELETVVENGVDEGDEESDDEENESDDAEIAEEGDSDEDSAEDDAEDAAEDDEDEEAVNMEEEAAEIIESSDDEAPEEITQVAVREEIATQKDSDEAVSAKKKTKRGGRSVAKRAERILETTKADDLDEEELPEDLLEAVLEAKKSQEEHEDEKQDKKKRKAKGPVVVGGTRPEDEIVQPKARSDNIQLAFTTTQNGREVTIYQDTKRRTVFEDEDLDSVMHESEDEELVGMDESVQNFAAQFLNGGRRERVGLAALQKRHLNNNNNKKKNAFNNNKRRKATRK